MLLFNILLVWVDASQLAAVWTRHVRLTNCKRLALWCKCFGIQVLKFASLLFSVRLPLQMSHCQLPESNLTLQSSIQGCGTWAVCASSSALVVLFPLFTLSVNTPSPLYPTAVDDISHPSQAFVRQLNPVPITFAGQQQNGKP